MIAFVCAALAVDPEDSDPKDEGTVTGGVLPALSVDPGTVGTADTGGDAARAAAALHVDPAFAAGVQAGFDLVYARRYGPAREHFAALETQFPGTVTRSIGDIVVWQALMLENFDYRYDKQYWAASKQARVDLAAADATPGNEAWEALVWASVLGIEGIHTMRQGSYLSALQLAFQSMDSIETCRRLAPEFVDLQLADGIYNYWRTVVTLDSKLLPDFGDHRVEGIQQMQKVANEGMFIRPLAVLSLAFTWLEEGDTARALEMTKLNRERYPDNIVNNMVEGMVLSQRHEYDAAMARWDAILRADPQNSRVHYWRGVTYLKLNQIESASGELTAYLETPGLEDWQRSYTHYRLGQIAARKEDYGEAMRQYEAAIKVDGNKSAKSARDRLVERKKAGQITF